MLINIDEQYNQFLYDVLFALRLTEEIKGILYENACRATN